MLSSRDEQIVKAVAYHRYMTADDICRLLFAPSSITHVRELLTKLAKTDLYRFRMPHSNIGNKEYVYAPHKKYVASYSHLLHALALTRFFVGLHTYCKDNPRARIEQQYISYELQKHPALPKTVIPDGWILVIKDGKKYPIMLEIDRGTIMQRQFKQQISNRVAFIRSGKYREVFCEEAVTIVYVTGDAVRADTLKRWTSEVLQEQNRESWESIFRFVSVEPGNIYQSEVFNAIMAD